MRLQLAADTAVSVIGLVRLFLDYAAKEASSGNLVVEDYDPGALTREYEIDELTVEAGGPIWPGLEPFTRESDARAFSNAKDRLRRSRASPSLSAPRRVPPRSSCSRSRRSRPSCVQTARLGSSRSVACSTRSTRPRFWSTTALTALI